MLDSVWEAGYLNRTKFLLISRNIQGMYPRLCTHLSPRDQSASKLDSEQIPASKGKINAGNQYHRLKRKVSTRIKDPRFQAGGTIKMRMYWSHSEVERRHPRDR